MYYSTFCSLCEKFGLSPTSAIIDMGLSRSNITNWKNGRLPKAEVLQVVAEYFDVPVDYLLNGEETKKAPSPKAEVSDDDIKVALFGGDGEVTEEMWAEVKRFAEYVKQRENEKR